MKKVQRTIVGAFITSNDGKVLLGKTKKGGIYQNLYVCPGGGVDDGETLLEGLAREIKEETGLLIDVGATKQINQQHGESEKTDPESGETFLAVMEMYAYHAQIELPSDQIEIVCEDDWHMPEWFPPNSLTEGQVSPPTAENLRMLGYL